MDTSKSLTPSSTLFDFFPSIKLTDKCSGNRFKPHQLPFPFKLTLVWNTKSQKFSFLWYDQVFDNSIHQPITDKNPKLELKKTKSEATAKMSSNNPIDTTIASRNTERKGIDLTLCYARFIDREICDEMLARMIKDGDNVGEDEYEDEDLNVMWFESEVLMLKHQENIKVFIFIQPSRLSRTFDTCLVSPVIVYDTDWINSFPSLLLPTFSNSISTLEFKETFYLSLVNLSIKMAYELQLGYTDCVLSVSPDCSPDRVKKLVDEGGFKVGVDMPRSILIKGKLARNLFLVKNFAPLREPRSHQQVTTEINRSYPPTSCDNLFESASLPKVSSLPLIYFLPNDRMLFIRNFTKEDASWLYELMVAACEEGKGYGFHEFPTFTFFKMHLLLEDYCAITHLMLKQKSYRLKDGAEISHQMLMSSLKNRSVLETLDLSQYPKIAGGTLCVSWFVRSQSVKAGESHLVVHSHFRNQKLGRELIEIQNALFVDLGFRLIVSDRLENNISMQKALKDVNFLPCGILPNVCYLKETGWVCNKIQVIDIHLNTRPSLCQLIDFNNEKAFVEKAKVLTSKY